jgi:polyhydroxybutyrate depolymerase
MRSFNRSTFLVTGAAMLLTSLISAPPSMAAVISFPGDRPFTLFLPTSYESSKPAPLILALHGYSSSGEKFEKYLNLTAVAQARGILYVHPDGTADKAGNRFWNATPECCDFAPKKVNDDGYLMSIIDEVSKKYNVDQDRIYVIGHSNGGFMANHMACSHADRLAAIVNIAGGTYSEISNCKPVAPVNVLQIWGTSDETYKINHILGVAIPGAVKTVASWARFDRCSKTLLRSSERLDLERKLPGKESTVGQYLGCESGATVESWTIIGGDHVPAISKTFTADIVDFLLAHPRGSKEPDPQLPRSQIQNKVIALS